VRSRLTWAALARLSAGLAAGCAVLPGADSGPALPPGVSSRVELSQVPFFPQEEQQCGPAALATALSAAGIDRTPEELVKDVFVPKRGGSLQVEMLGSTRRAGLLAYRVPPDLVSLMREVDAGRPVVVLQNLLFDIYPRWHYAVVVGYDTQEREMILRSGARQRLVVSFSRFDRTWARGARWAFLALPPGQIPATATEDSYVAAAADLERVAPASARIAYEAALARWPHDLVARIGLGNLAYASHDRTTAEEQYRLATQEHPDSADAWNNLAQVLHESGRDEEALSAAERAVAIGGARESIYRATRECIQSACGAAHTP